MHNRATGSLKSWFAIGMILLTILSVAAACTSEPEAPDGGGGQVPGGSPTFTGVAGGTGGEPFTLDCSPGWALIGIGGRSGNVIDSIYGICASFDQTLTPMATAQTAIVGGTGGTEDYEFRCPNGRVVVGLEGRFGWYVDKIGIRCDLLLAEGLAGGNPASQPYSAGGDGGEDFSFDCQGNAPASGLRGRRGNLIDRIGLSCQTANITLVQPGDSDQPDLRAVIKDLPFMVDEYAEVTLWVEIWNIGDDSVPAGAVFDIAANHQPSQAWIESPFLGNATCDTVNVQSPTFARCTTGNAIAPGSAIGVSVRFHPNITGIWQFTARTDPDNQIVESNEDNNGGAATMDVQ